jgi:hypothetical protein
MLVFNQSKLHSSWFSASSNKFAAFFCSNLYSCQFLNSRVLFHNSRVGKWNPLLALPVAVQQALLLLLPNTLRHHVRARWHLEESTLLFLLRVCKFANLINEPRPLGRCIGKVGWSAPAINQIAPWQNSRRCTLFSATCLSFSCPPWCSTWQPRHPRPRSCDSSSRKIDDVATRTEWIKKHLEPIKTVEFLLEDALERALALGRWLHAPHPC